MPLKHILIILFLLLYPKNSSAQTDTSLITQKNSLAWKFRSSNIDTSILLSKEAYALLIKIPGSESLLKHWKEKALVRTYYYLGTFYSNKGDQKLGFDYFAKALKISMEIRDDYGMSQVFGGLGNAYHHLGNLSKASENYFKALKIHEKRANKAGVAVQLSNLGNIFASQGSRQKAIEYYFKSLAIAEELHDSARVSIQLGNIGTIYYELGNFPQAMEYFFKALKITEIIGNKKGIAMNLNNIASVYQDKKEYLKALDYFTRALNLSKEYGNQEHTASFIGNIGILYYLMKDFQKSEAYLSKAIAISREVEATETVQEFEGALSELYSAWGKHQLALEHFKKHISARDSIINVANTEKSVRLEMNYEFEKKQAVDKALHQKQLLLLEAENKTQRQFRLFLFVILGLAILLLLVLRRAYENKKRIAKFLTEEGQRKETLLQEVHHRINNNLQIISSLLTLQANNVADEKLFEYLKQSQSRIQSLSVLHDLLYRHDSSLDIDMKEYLNEVLNFHRDILSTKLHHVNLQLNVSPVSFPTKIAVPIALIVNELVTNSIKYAFQEADKGKIDVSLFARDKTWVLRVSDTGKGMLSDVSTSRESLGLRLVNLMAKQIGASVERSDSPGTTFILTFSTNN